MASASTSARQQVNSPAMVRSQGLRRPDERASPKGANGNVLNLKQQPLCQNHRGRGGERGGREELFVQTERVTVVTARPILYADGWRVEDKGVSRHKGRGTNKVVSARGGRGKPGRCCLSLLLTCLNYSGPSAVKTASSLLLCTQTVNGSSHSTPHLRQVLFTLLLVFLSGH